MDYSVALSESVNGNLQNFLLQDKSREEVCFATWNPASGKLRLNILLDEIIFPKNGERIRKIGTASALPCYVDRCKEHAREVGSGLVMIHTHPFLSGHQSVSVADLYYEQDVLAREVFGVTGMPLVGMTLAGDGIWSGRIYPKPFKIIQCRSVRIVGKNLHVNYHPDTRVRPLPNQKQRRTVSVWGETRQSMMMGLNVGIIGVGSIGSAVGEILCRMGVSNIHLMDYDRVKEHNLDRMNNVASSDIGKFKKDVVLSNLLKSATSDRFCCTSSANSIVEPEGFKEALDCDVLFCCVDRPWPRQVLNHMSYSCLIPVTDGGVLFRIHEEQLKAGMFRAQTVGAERACLDCLGTLRAEEIVQDRQGLFDDPKYISRMEEDDKRQSRQNIMPFVFGLASLETIQFVELVTNLAKKGDIGQQPYDYMTGEILPKMQKCRSNCHYQKNLSKGDIAPPVLITDESRRRTMSDH